MDNQLDIRPLTPLLGAEVMGCDLDRATAAESAQLVDALHRHGVLVLRNQRCTPDAQVRFAELFGPIEVPVVSEYLLPRQPKILVLSNIVRDGRPIGATDAGQWWHVDMSYKDPPARCTFLHAIEIPFDAQGQPLGDTMFASAAAAYDALSADDRSALRNAAAVHSHAWRYAKVVAESGGKRRALSEEEKARNPDVVHPVIRPHPKTGRPCLYVNEGYTARIAGLSETESNALLRRLVAHATDPRFTYRHRWRLDDLVVWDNCIVQHRATGGYDASNPRLMHRIVVRDVAP
jgi:taurine dioxygenase